MYASHFKILDLIGIGNFLKCLKLQYKTENYYFWRNHDIRKWNGILKRQLFLLSVRHHRTAAEQCETQIIMLIIIFFLFCSILQKQMFQRVLWHKQAVLYLKQSQPRVVLAVKKSSQFLINRKKSLYLVERFDSQQITTTLPRRRFLPASTAPWSLRKLSTFINILGWVTKILITWSLNLFIMCPCQCSFNSGYTVCWLGCVVLIRVTTWCTMANNWRFNQELAILSLTMIRTTWTWTTCSWFKFWLKYVPFVPQGLF